MIAAQIPPMQNAQRTESLIKPGERVRVHRYTCSHDRLTLIVDGDHGRQVRIELVMCARVSFAPMWRAGAVSISVADDPALLRVFDQGFEVLCEEVQRWESPDQPTIRLTSKDLLSP
jgi:hypothetical protein